MKRYTPPYVDWLSEGKMIEREEGPYVKYEDMIKMMRTVLDRHHILLDIEKRIKEFTR